MALALIRKDYLEILKLLKEGDMQSSRLAESVKSVSISEAYKRIKTLEKEGLIEHYTGENERGQPIKIYRLTELGRLVLERVEELEEKYQKIRIKK